MSGHPPGGGLKIPVHSFGETGEPADVPPNCEREIIALVVAIFGSGNVGSPCTYLQLAGPQQERLSQ
jgi:hypothetical protein